MTKHHPSHHRKKTILLILLILLGIAAVWTIFNAKKYYYAPHIEESHHFLYLTVVTDKNLTESEILGYTNDTQGKYVIIYEGGIYFYELSPGLSLTRELEVENKGWYPVDVETEAQGDITQFLTVEAPKLLEPKSTGIINFTVSVPTENVLAGKYRGNFTVRLIPKKT